MAFWCNATNFSACWFFPYWWHRHRRFWSNLRLLQELAKMFLLSAARYSTSNRMSSSSYLTNYRSSWLRWLLYQLLIISLHPLNQSFNKGTVDCSSMQGLQKLKCATCGTMFMSETETNTCPSCSEQSHSHHEHGSSGGMGGCGCGH